MTSFAKLLPVASHPQILPAYVRPVEIALLSFWNFIKSTRFAMKGAAKMVTNPLVNIIVGCLFTKKVIVLSPIIKTVTSLGTEFSFVARAVYKNLFTGLASYAHTFTLVICETDMRTKIIASRPHLIRDSIKSLITTSTVYIRTAFEKASLTFFTAKVPNAPFSAFI